MVLVKQADWAGVVLLQEPQSLGHNANVITSRGQRKKAGFVSRRLRLRWM
jgi:hypothetical protein